MSFSPVSMSPANNGGLPDVLTDHLGVLAEVEQVLQEENSLLKHTGEPPDDAFIRRKSMLLPRLETSLGALRSRGREAELSTLAREMLRDAQRRLHKLLLLDRENESLLLRCAIQSGGLPAGPVKFGAGQLARIYGQS